MKHYTSAPFTHRFALEYEAVAVVRQPIEDGIGEGLITELGMPLIYWQLTGCPRLLKCSEHTSIQECPSAFQGKCGSSDRFGGNTRPAAFGRLQPFTPVRYGVFERPLSTKAALRTRPIRTLPVRPSLN